jgi:hypothetical protein
MISKAEINDGGEPSSSSNQDDVKQISEFFQSNAIAIEKWLKESAPDEVISQISGVISKRKPCEREHRSSVTSELYQQWLSSTSSSSPSNKVKHTQNVLIFFQTILSINRIKYRVGTKFASILTSLHLTQHYFSLSTQIYVSNF